MDLGSAFRTALKYLLMSLGASSPAKKPAPAGQAPETKPPSNS